MKSTTDARISAVSSSTCGRGEGEGEVRGDVRGDVRNESGDTRGERRAERGAGVQVRTWAVWWYGGRV